MHYRTAARQTLARHRHAAVRRLEAEHAVQAGRDANRAAAVGTERYRHHAARHCDAGAARATAGQSPRVVGVARHVAVRIAAERRQAVFGHGRRAEDDRAGRAQACRRGAVRGGRDRRHPAGSDARRDAFDVHLFLDSDGHSVERAERFAAAQALGGIARGGPRSFGSDVQEHAAARAPGGQALRPGQGALHQLLRIDPLFAEGGGVGRAGAWPVPAPGDSELRRAPRVIGARTERNQRHRQITARLRPQPPRGIDAELPAQHAAQDMPRRRVTCSGNHRAESATRHASSGNIDHAAMLPHAGPRCLSCAQGARLGLTRTWR